MPLGMSDKKLKVNGTQKLLICANDAYCVREYVDTKQEHSFITLW